MSLRIIYRHSRFIPLFWAQFLSVVGINVFRNALVILIAYRGIALSGLGPNMIVALTGGIFILPYFLLSATAGQLADRMDKARLLRIVKACELLIAILVAVGFYWDDYGLLLAALFLLGIQATFFGPLKYGILPDLVAESELVSANGYVVASTFVAILVGTITGGAITTLVHTKAILIASVLLLAIVGLLAGWRVPSTRAHAPGLRVEWSMVRPTRAILRQIRADPAIHQSILAMSWFWLLGAGMVSILPIYCKDVLHADKGVVTLFLALFTLGIGVGAALCDRLSFARVEVGLIPGGLIGTSLFLLDLGLQGWSWPVPAGDEALLPLAAFIGEAGGWRLPFDVFMTAVLGGLFIMPLYSFVQQRAEAAVIARVMAGNNILNALYGVLGSLTIVLLFRFGVEAVTVILLASVTNLVAGAWLFRQVPEFRMRFLGWIGFRLLHRTVIAGAGHVPGREGALLVCDGGGLPAALLACWALRRPVRPVLDAHAARSRRERFLLWASGWRNPATPAKFRSSGEDAAREIAAHLSRGGLALVLSPSVRKSGEGGSAMDPIRIATMARVPLLPFASGGTAGDFAGPPDDSVGAPVAKGWRSLVVLKIGRPLPPEETDPLRLSQALEQCRLEGEDSRHGLPSPQPAGALCVPHH